MPQLSPAVRFGRDRPTRASAGHTQCQPRRFPTRLGPRCQSTRLHSSASASAQAQRAVAWRRLRSQTPRQPAELHETPPRPLRAASRAPAGSPDRDRNALRPLRPLHGGTCRVHGRGDSLRLRNERVGRRRRSCRSACSRPSARAHFVRCSMLTSLLYPDGRISFPPVRHLLTLTARPAASSTGRSPGSDLSVKLRRRPTGPFFVSHVSNPHSCRPPRDRPAPRFRCAARRPS